MIFLPWLSRSVISLSWPSIRWGSLVSCSFFVWSLGYYSWCISFSIWWSCIFLRTLFIVYGWRLPQLSSFRNHGWCWWRYHFIGLLIVDLCWIMSVMVSLMVLMSSSSCCVSSQVLNSIWNSDLWPYLCGISSPCPLVHLRPVWCCSWPFYGHFQYYISLPLNK